MQFIPMNYTFIKIKYPQLGSFKYLYDPFVGSGQTFLNFLDKDINRKRILSKYKVPTKVYSKPAASYYISDINPNTIDIYKCIKDNSKELISVLSNYKKVYDSLSNKDKKIFFKEQRELYNKFTTNYSNELLVNKVAIFIFLSRVSHSLTDNDISLFKTRFRNLNFRIPEINKIASYMNQRIMNLSVNDFREIDYKDNSLVILHPPKDKLEDTIALYKKLEARTFVTLITDTKIDINKCNRIQKLYQYYNYK